MHHVFDIVLSTITWGVLFLATWKLAATIHQGNQSVARLEVLVAELITVLRTNHERAVARPAQPQTGVLDFTATTAVPISEESIKVASARITEELRARGSNASPEQIRAHVLDLLGG